MREDAVGYRVPEPERHGVRSRFVVVDGLRTHYLECGEGPTVVALHSGEFGACAELSWEYNLAALGRHFRVVCPDMLGFGLTAKIHDFGDRRARVLHHLRRFCEVMEIANVPFLGNSMSATMVLRDAASDRPLLPSSAMVAIAGGGHSPHNEDRETLLSYDCTRESMRQVLKVLFHHEVWSNDDNYLDRRHRLSLVPGAWECAAAARFHAPAGRATPEFGVPDGIAYERINRPTFLLAGREDRLKEPGYVEGVSARIPGCRFLEVPDTAHCPHIEDSRTTTTAIVDFLLSLPTW